MKIILQNAPSDGVISFQESLRDLGHTVDIEHPPPAPLQAAGPAGVVQVCIDPETLRLIFEYAAALIGIYKTTDYFGAFFRAAIEKCGQAVGAKIVEALSALWKNLNNRVITDHANGQNTRIYLSLEVDADEGHISIDNSIFASHIQGFSSNDHDQAFYLIAFRILPLLREFMTQCRHHHVRLDVVSAGLQYALPGKPWSWWIKILPIGTFTLTSSGILRAKYSLDGFRWRPLARRRFIRRGIENHEVATIVRAFAKSKL